MSISRDCSEPGRKIWRSQEKSNFAQTCSLLSQYLKEKGSFGDLSLGITCSNSEGNAEKSRQTAATRNFLQNVEIPGEVPGISAPFSHNMKYSMDLFPRKVGFGPSAPVQDVPKKADFRAKIAPEASQMTIFYAGKVLVFDNFPVEKANEVMLLATNASSQNPINNQKNTNGFVPSSCDFLSASGCNNSSLEHPQRPPQPTPSVLPITRKASLQRFLEKRKDRLNTRVPYQVNNSVLADESKIKPLERKKSWLDIAAQARNPFELQF